MFWFVICLLVALCYTGLFLAEYFNIDLYDTIYFNRIDKNDQVVVLEKNMFFVKVGRTSGEPENMLLFDFLINYTANI